MVDTVETNIDANDSRPSRFNSLTDETPHWRSLRRWSKRRPAGEKLKTVYKAGDCRNNPRTSTTPVPKRSRKKETVRRSSDIPATLEYETP